MADFIQQALARSPQDGPAWLEEVRKAGRSHWQTRALPTRKTEAWKSTNLRALERGAYLGKPEKPAET
ncbi:MAG: hypothetical protein HUJ31_02120, partial [Pseudomonadales bacterium]|nr:hypothetical protein [Pseudomonadales bacterium]